MNPFPRLLCCCVPCATVAQIAAQCSSYPPYTNKQNICVEGESGGNAVLNSTPNGINIPRVSEKVFEYVQAGIRKFNITYDGTGGGELKSYIWSGGAWSLVRTIYVPMDASNPYQLYSIGGGVFYRHWLTGVFDTTVQMAITEPTWCTGCIFRPSGKSWKISNVTGLSGNKTLVQGYPYTDFGTGLCTHQAKHGTADVDMWNSDTSCTGSPDASATLDIIWSLFGTTPSFELHLDTSSYSSFFGSVVYSLMFVNFGPLVPYAWGDPIAGSSIGPRNNSSGQLCSSGQDPNDGDGDATIITPDRSGL